MCLHKGAHTKPHRFIEFHGDSSWFPLRRRCQHPSLTGKSHFSFVFVSRLAGKLGVSVGKGEFLEQLQFWCIGSVLSVCRVISALHAGWMSAAKPSCLGCLNCVWFYEIKLKCCVITALSFAALCQYHATWFYDVVLHWVFRTSSCWRIKDICDAFNDFGWTNWAGFGSFIELNLNFRWGDEVQFTWTF